MIRRLCLVWLALAVVPLPAGAQTVPGVLGNLGGGAGAPAQPTAPSYGVQPYNPSNPTGFNHPNDQGFGTYQNPTPFKGHRASTTTYRRFKGN